MDTRSPEISFPSMNVPFPYASTHDRFTTFRDIRSRREISTRDAANVRQFEHWQTDAPYLQMDRPDVNGAKILSDMNPTNSRTLNGQLYLQNRPMKAGQDNFTNNPYFQGYAPEYDSRNAVRELRSVIYEDRFDKGIRESKQLLGRVFTTDWLDSSYVKDNNLNTLNSLEAYEQLKPHMDDISKTFRNKPGKNPIQSISVGRKKKEEEQKSTASEKKVDTTVMYAK